MLALSLRSSSGTAARLHRKAAVRLASIQRCQSVSDRSASGPQ